MTPVATAPGNITVVSDGHCFNRWLGLFYNPGHAANDDLLFANRSGTGFYQTKEEAHTSFVQSPFHLGGYPDSTLVSFPVEGIPQMLHNGPGQGHRIGSDVCAIKDHWSFKFTIPPEYNPRIVDSTTFSGLNWAKHDTTKVFPSLRCSQRPVKLRLIGIMQHTLDRAGDIGFRPAELFKRTDRIDTHFQTDNARGYKVVYDKTKTFAMTPFNPYAATDGTINTPTDVANGATISDTGVSMRQFEANFGWKGRYKLSYADTSPSGLQCPMDFPGLDETVSPQVGVTKNMITWYAFLEDRFPYRKTEATGINTTKYYPVCGLKCEVTRRFRYTDN